MASLIQQHGRYYLQFYSKDRSPKRKRVALHVRVKRDAEKIRRKLEADYATGKFDPWTDDPLTYDRVVLKPERLEDAAGAFYAAKKHLAERTQQEYRKIVSRFVDFVGAEAMVSTVRAADVQRWLDSTDAGNVTRHNYTRHLKVFFRWAKKEGLTDTVATDSVKLPKVPKKFTRFLTPAEVEAIAEAAESEGLDWLAHVVPFAAHTGLRRSELVNLQWQHVDLGNRMLTVSNTDTFTTKSGEERKVPLSDTAVDVLEGRREATGYVFTHSRGQIGPDYLSAAFKRCAIAAGIEDVHLHHLRHTACSWLAERGVPVEAIRRFAGHSTIAVTEKYMAVAEDVYARQVSAALNG